MTSYCAVLGDPVDHSLSPVLHRAGYAALGLDFEYAAHRVPLGQLSTFVGEHAAALRGLSLTMPLKREAMAVATQINDEARRAGAANTLVFDGEAVVADNTDVPGAVAAMREAGVTEVARATILGGGATAASTALALVDLGVQQLRVAVREHARAADTVDVVRRAAPHVDLATVLLTDLDADGHDDHKDDDNDVVVSTIPAEAQTPGLVAWAARSPVVFDVLYHPWPTPLAAAVGAGGRVLVGGLDLLVHQALVQFELFTGHYLDVDVMRHAGRAALEARA